MFNNQFAAITGSKGKINIKTPFTPAPDEKAVITYRHNEGFDEIIFGPCDKYTIQGDLFSLAVLNDTDVPTPISDAVLNMKVIDKIKESSKNNNWVEL